MSTIITLDLQLEKPKQRQVCKFPLATKTNNHKLSGVEQHNFILS